MAKRTQKQRLEEFQPPEKKLVGEVDLLIKELAKKQANTRINLIGQLAEEKRFEKSSSFTSTSNIPSGQCSIAKLKEIIATNAEFDEWKTAGLCDDDVILYNDYKEGINVLYEKHPKYEKSLLLKRIECIENTLENYKAKKKSPVITLDNFKDATVDKPESNEAKLLKFALANKKIPDVLPHPMDTLKALKSDLEFKINLREIASSNLNKIRRKARKLQHRLHKNNDSNNELVINNQIENHEKEDEDKLHAKVINLHSTQIDYLKQNKTSLQKLDEKEEKVVNKNIVAKKSNELLAQFNVDSDLLNKEVDNFYSENDLVHGGKSKWDVKMEELVEPKSIIEEKKVYDCKPQKFYTVRNKAIIPLEHVREIECTGQKMSLEDIKKMPKFQNYLQGPLNNVLYLKNLNRISAENLKYLCMKYGNLCKTDNVEFKVMSGRMKGQAFITCPDSTIASSILKEMNGLIVNGKPLIVQYGKNT